MKDRWIAEEPSHIDMFRRDIIASLLGLAAGGPVAQLLATQDEYALEASVDDGCRRTLVDAVSGTGTLTYADTATKLRAITGGSVTWVAILGGCQSRGDGGGGVFYWEDSPSRDDGGTILNANAGNSAGWRRMRVGKTYNADWFIGRTKEIQITNAVAAAAAAGAQYVHVPTNMLPYKASSVAFHTSIHMIRQGGRADAFDVQAYGAAGDGTQNDTAAFMAAIAAAGVAFGEVWVPPATSSYRIATTLALLPNTRITGGSVGAGDTSRLTWSGGDSTMFYFLGTSEAQGMDVTLERLQLTGPTTSGIAVRIRNFSGFKMRDCTIDHWAIGLWADWGQSLYLTGCQVILNTRGVQIGGNLSQATTPVPTAGIRRGAFAPNFMDTVVVRETQFSQNQVDINYCGSQYALGGFWVVGCRFFESRTSPVVGKTLFINVSGAQSAEFQCCQVESPHNRSSIVVTSIGLDTDMNGPSWGVAIRGCMFVSTTASTNVIVITRGTAYIDNNTFVCNSSATPITLSDSTSRSVVRQNMYLAFVNGAVPTECLTTAVVVTGAPSGIGHDLTQPVRGQLSTPGVKTAATTKTSNYAATSSDCLILCDATSAAFTVTLPTASGNNGVLFRIKKTDSSAHAVTVATGGGNIDGAPTRALSTQYASLDVQSDGTSWFIL